MAFTDFNLNVVKALVVKKARRALLPTNALSRKISKVPLATGASAEVPVVTAITGTVRTKTELGAYTGDQQEPAMVSIDIDQNAYIGILWSAPKWQAVIEMGGNVNEAIAEQIVEDLVQDFWTKLFANFTAANVPTIAGPTTRAGWDYDALVDLWASDTDTHGANVKFSSIFNPLVWGELLKEPLFNNSSVDADVVNGVMRHATLPNVLNSHLYMADRVPNNAESLAGIRLAPQAFALAMAPVPHVAEVGKSSLAAYQVLGDKTGLQITYRQIQDGAVDSKLDVFEFNWGAAILDSTLIARHQDTT